MKSVLVTEGEEVYEKNREKLEKAHLGKIVAIEIESGAVAGIGESLDEAYEEALKKYPGKKFYFRKVGPCAAPGYLFQVDSMMIAYKEDMPEVRIKVKGRNGEIEYDAYLDTGAFKCLIPQTDAVKMGLPYAGDAEIITGTGKDHIKLYKATITFLKKDFSVLVLGRDLPEQAMVKAIVGRDILDKYRICFDGVRKGIDIT